jgi:hypothetical protein
LRNNKKALVITDWEETGDEVDGEQIYEKWLALIVL